MSSDDEAKLNEKDAGSGFKGIFGDLAEKSLKLFHDDDHLQLGGIDGQVDPVHADPFLKYGTGI